MPEPEFIIADIRRHRPDLLELNVEYVSWVFSQVDSFHGVNCAEIVGLPAAAYVETVIAKICDQSPPQGVFYLVRVNSQFAAMGGLRGLKPDVVEIKRIYVRPAFRGMRLGELILARLLDDARKFGYARVWLDTGPFMKTAHRLYEAWGFADRPPYAEVEVPAILHSRWRFMERSLRP